MSVWLVWSTQCRVDLCLAFIPDTALLTDVFLFLQLKIVVSLVSVCTLAIVLDGRFPFANSNTLF